jgi:hypothetical protein
MYFPTDFNRVFFLTRSGTAFIFGAPTFRPSSLQLADVKQPANDKEISALLASLRSRDFSEDEDEVSAFLRKIWVRSLNKTGCILSAGFFGCEEPLLTKTDAVNWLVSSRVPVLTYDILHSVTSRFLVSDLDDLPVCDAESAYDSFLEEGLSSRSPAEVRATSSPAARHSSGIADSFRAAAVSHSAVGSSTSYPIDITQDTRVSELLARERALTSEVQALRAEQRLAKRPRDGSESADDGYDGLYLKGTHSSPFARLIARLKVNLLSFEYVNVLHYSYAHRESVGLLNTKSPSSRLTIHEGQLRADEGDGVAVSSTWPLFRCGFLFVVRAMMELESRLSQAADRLEFLEFLENQCFYLDQERVRYAEQFMFRHKKELFWAPLALTDPSLLYKAASRAHQAPPIRVSKSRSSPGILKASVLPGQLPTLAVPLGYCLSRIARSKSCSRSPCRFSHSCPYCPGKDHAASVCPKAPA